MADCNTGYYSGWNRNEAHSLDGCLNLCLGDPRCRFVSFLRGQTCSRYDQRAGSCRRGAPMGYVTYGKRDPPCA